MLPYLHRVSQSLVPGISLRFSSLHAPPWRYYCIDVVDVISKVKKIMTQLKEILSLHRESDIISLWLLTMFSFQKKGEAKSRCEQDGIGHFSNLLSPILDVPSAKYAASWVLACFVFAQSNIPRTIWDQSTRRISRSITISVSNHNNEQICANSI